MRAPPSINGPHAFSLAVGDLNGDGTPDLVIGAAGTNFSNSTLTVLLGNGDGFFHQDAVYAPGGHDTLGVAVADFNGDGALDVAAANEFSNNVGVLLNANNWPS
jgi:hypothetical protein